MPRLGEARESAFVPGSGRRQGSGGFLHCTSRSVAKAILAGLKHVLKAKIISSAIEFST